MRPFDELEGYLKRIQQRIAMSTLARGGALAFGSALLATVILVWIANAFGFSEGVVTTSRLLLFLVCAFALSFGIILPLLRLNQRRTAREVESKFPVFGERLLTCVEQKESGNPFLDLVAADAMKLSTQAAPEEISKTSRIAAFSSAAIAALATLAWLILAGPGYFGYGAALLWGATPKEGSKPIYDIIVSPGDKLVRRKADQAVNARIIGFSTNKAQLFAKYQGATKWEQAPMMPQPQGDAFEFLFSNLPTAVEYYVEAGGTKSKTFKLSVVDLPGVKKMRVNYKYPSWTGLKPVSDEQSADLRAVAGTEAEVNILTDKPLNEGVLVFDDGRKIPLTKGEGNWLQAKVSIEKDGMYHVAAMEQGQAVRLTEDFFIEARPETPPVIKVSKPGRDMKVSPIEEVPIQVSAEDDFAVAEMQIHYSVNGGEEKVLNVLPSKGLKQAEGKAMLNLEEFKLVPGDVVGFYATAKDARSEARTDMYFIEAQPFERHYQQSQQGGGGGGEGGQQQDDEISRRQKEIIAATWNQIRDKSADRNLRAENAKFLAEMQAKLRDQARSLARRMQNRELTGASDSFQLFAKDMESAAKEMDAASASLKDQKFQDSVPAEQRALQHLLRAEARRRDIQVAFGQQGGGGGGGGQSGRDLESLFDLELDTEKNQYETGRQQASGSQRQQEIDKALQKLEQLARRQQELAQQAQRNQLTPQQKWQQEMLRREAEQLRREMEQMARGQQGQQQQQQGSPQSGQQQTQTGQQGQQQQQQGRPSQGGGAMGGQPSPQQQQQQRLQEMMRQRMNQAGGQRDQIDPRVKQALDQITKAEEDMRRAGESSADARRAADRLAEARGALRGMQQQQSADQLSDLARRSEGLADRQRDFTNRLRQTYGQGAGDQQQQQQQQPGQRPGMSQPQMKGTPEQNEQFAQEKLKLMEEYRKLESDIKDASRELQSTKKGAAQQLRKALGEVEGEDLSLKMKMMSEYLRRGYGSMAWMREQPVTQSLERLRDQVKAAQQAAGQDPNGQQNQRGVEAALNELEQLRERMSRLTQGRQQGQGSQQRPGESQPGQQQQSQQSGRQGQQQGQQGQQPGQGGQSGQQGQPQQGQGQQQAGGGQRSGGESGGATRFQGGGGERRGAFGAMNDGSRMPDVGGMEAPEQAFREGLRDLQQMRQAIRGEASTAGQEGEDVSREAEALIREMQALDPSKFPGNPKLVEQIRTQLMPRIEQLELMLRRSLDERNTDQVRSGAGSRIPNGYSDAVAEYYRRLGKAKK